MWIKLKSKKEIDINFFATNISERTWIDSKEISKILRILRSEMKFYLLDWFSINIPWIVKVKQSTTVRKLRYSHVVWKQIPIKKRRKLKSEVSINLQRELLELIKLQDKNKKETK